MASLKPVRHRFYFEWLVCRQCGADYRMEGDLRLGMALLVPLGMRVEITRCQCGWEMTIPVMGM